MNVLHIDEQKHWRGGEQQAEYLIRHLAQQGHRCVVAGPKHRPFVSHDFGVDGVVRQPVPCRGEWDLPSAVAIARIVREHNTDILHAHTGHAHALASLAARIGRRGKVVVSRRVSVAPKRGPLNRLKYRMPDQYIAISEAAAAGLYGVGVPKDRVVIVHSGIALDRFEIVPVDRSELGIPEDALLLGAVGALVPIKDHKTLVEAMPHVLERVPNVHLCIAGEGECRADLENRIETLNLAGNVRLLGHREDVPGLLRALDTFVMPSVSEGLGSSILDAMACALPVVATKAGGIPEAVVDGKTGLLCPPGDPAAMADALVALLRDPEGMRRMGAAGRARVEQSFTAEAMARGTVAVYERMLNG